MVLRNGKYIFWLMVFAACTTEQEPLTEKDLKGTPMEKGEQVYIMKCARCHGADGSKGASGAKNLKVSSMSEEEISNIIQNGKEKDPKMPAFNKEITKGSKPERWLIEHVLSLRN